MLSGRVGSGSPPRRMRPLSPSVLRNAAACGAGPRALGREPPRHPPLENGDLAREDADATGPEESAAPPVLARLRKRVEPRRPRQIRAVPTNAQLKIDRALDLFNASEHPRTIAGIARTLGTPHGSAVPSNSSAAEVLLTVAWELSWYQFTVDLSDPGEPVQVRAQGTELGELEEHVREWNLEADAEGCLIPLGASSQEGEQLETVTAAQSGGEAPG